MGLSVALAIGYGRFMGGAISHRSSLAASILAGAGALATVWAINFFVLLPILNPAFVILMPYSVSLMSKLLFGASMGWVLFARRKHYLVCDQQQPATYHQAAH
jgi:predicted neutral ceramidase superfamily lipid hydrolase